MGCGVRAGRVEKRVRTSRVVPEVGRDVVHLANFTINGLEDIRVNRNIEREYLGNGRRVGRAVDACLFCNLSYTRGGTAPRPPAGLEGPRAGGWGIETGHE